ncbi:MAG: L,D-transpeptidase family protein [Flavisolibacter sp.]|nr:L,D-transpeptidase family protein [Flavisolibacter sp.]
MNKIFITFFIPIAIFSCRNSGANSAETTETFLSQDSYAALTNLTLDSTIIEKFIGEQKIDKVVAEKIRSFYNSRNYQYAWFNEDGVAEQAHVFWDLHNQYINYSQDSSFFDKQLHHQMDFILSEEESDWNLSENEIANLELEMTAHFFDFAKTRYTGKLNPNDVQWNIPVRKIDAVGLLDSLVSTKGENLEEWEPLHKQYRLMKKQVLRYHELEKNKNWKSEISSDKKVLRKGDTAVVITEIKKKLEALGDLQPETHSEVFDSQFEQAVIHFQKRHGVNQDGVIGPVFFKLINVPLEERIQQLLINMERMRWLPEPGEGTRIVANIPSFTMHVYEGEKEIFTTDIVVGKAGTRTVIFNDKLEYVVFSPYWNIPRSITRNEIVPAMNRDPNYLSKNNMEITGRSNGLPVIRQKPGPNNSLGKVKFIFPNRYSIYFHDTPAKSLFERDQRAFSHGCIRVKEPHKLASYLLQNFPSWNDSGIRGAMNSGSEKWVKLDNPVPVLISYFTAWVDEDGKLNFRNDIYGHDKKMISQLFSHTSH